MQFLKKIFVKSAWDLEQAGDKQMQRNAWGNAKVEYEKALVKLEKNLPIRDQQKQEIENKLLECKEALAQQHIENAKGLMESGFLEDARELLNLASLLTQKPAIKAQVEADLEMIGKKTKETSVIPEPDYMYGLDDESDSNMDDASQKWDSDEFFMALMGTLPLELQNAYLKYGDTFKAGYLALNQGEFKTAVDLLSQALTENTEKDSYIPFELASAYVNLGMKHNAQELLENFIEIHPGVLPAYRLLCEIYWEEKEFENVDVLLKHIPLEYSESVEAFVLKGENLMVAGKYLQAKEFFENFQQNYGWNLAVARNLAQSIEALGEKQEALSVYSEIITQCATCHTKADPFDRRKFADLSLAAGDYSAKILETYLALASEDPANQAYYFRQVSAIYQKQGHTNEAQRYKNLSEKNTV